MEIKTKAALFREPGIPLEIVEVGLNEEILSGFAVCRVIMSTICGSDLHTISGRRKEPAPLVLGHEIIGEVVNIGKDFRKSRFGDDFRIGDRVTWSIMASCDECFFCAHGLPQKCTSLRKYGHTCFNEVPHLTGGYAEYICLFSGTAVFRIPGSVPDEIATPANCALSTVINAMETSGLEKGESVLVQGAGLLGLNMIALAKEAGAGKIIVSDVSPERLELAGRFGADVMIDLRKMTSPEFLSVVSESTGGRGVDVAVELCGVKEAVPQAIQALRTGGRYVVAGLVSPGSDFLLDGNTLTRKTLTIKGIHNYHPGHLGKAVRFLEKNSGKYPYGELVGEVFPLEQINEAVGSATSGKYIRIAIRP
jgi:alcohol dehydrogenase